MRAEFPLVRLQDVCAALKDGTHGTHTRVPKGIPFLSAKNVTEAGQVRWDDTDDHISEAEYKAIHRSFSLQPNDLLLTIVGSLGRRALHDGSRATFQRSVAYVRPDEARVTPWFLFHATGGAPFQRQLVRRSNATAQAGLYLGELALITVPLPPLREQRRIAEILDTLDEAIRKTELVIAKLQQVKRGLLHDLLTRGIDENGELRDPERHPEQFKDSPLGRIPKAWEVCELSSVSQVITSGSRGWAPYYSEHGALFLRIGNLTREHINLRFDAVIRVQPPRGGEGRRTAAKPGDLLISITADLGMIGVVPVGLGECYVNQHVALVRLDPNRVVARWVGHFLAGESGKAQFDRLNDQGAKSGLNLPAVGRLKVALPGCTEQEGVAGVLDEHDERIRHERAGAAKLRLLKQGLMDDLLTGRVRVAVPEEAA